MNTPSHTPARRPSASASEKASLPGPAWLASVPSAHDHHVAVLAHTVWQQNGSPPDRQQEYRHEVDAQLRATRHWLEQELSDRATPGPDANPIFGAP